MEPLHPHKTPPETSQIPMLGYHAYVGIIRTLGRGDDGFCPSTPAALLCALDGWTGGAGGGGGGGGGSERGGPGESAQMYMPPLTPIT
jgi:hypothetical protein